MGKRIKLLREDKKYTLFELSSKVGITRQSLSKIEKCLCAPSPIVVSKLSKALGVTMEFLIDGVERVPAPSKDIKIITSSHTDNYIKNNIINK